jgi:hypothetical protein
MYIEIEVGSQIIIFKVPSLSNLAQAVMLLTFIQEVSLVAILARPLTKLPEGFHGFPPGKFWDTTLTLKQAMMVAYIHILSNSLFNIIQSCDAIYKGELSKQITNGSKTAVMDIICFYTYH